MTTRLMLPANLRGGRIAGPIDRLLSTLAETVTLLMVFVMLADIPKVGFFPVSPLFLLILGAFFLVLLTTSAPIEIALREFPLALWGFLILALAVGVSKFEVRAIVVFFAGPAVFVVIFCRMTCSKGMALRMTRGIALFYLASGTWLLLSTLRPELFAAVRQFLYAAHQERFAGGDLLMAYPTGLTFGHFAMGYQLSVGMILALLLVPVEKGAWKFCWLVTSLLLAVAVILSGQRSVIPAIAVALGIFLMHGRRLRVAILLILLAGLGFLLTQGMDTTASSAPGLEAQLMSKKIEKDDYSTRLGWQVAALRIITKNPFGNIFGELDWEKEAGEHGADFEIYEGQTKAVHNAYLGNALEYGWIGLALVLMTIWLIVRNLLWRVLDRAYSRCQSQPYALICVLALVSAMVQALFHNANLFTWEPSTWIIFSTACAWVWLMRREKRARC